MLKLRLSEAIRLGSLLHPQTHGNLYVREFAHHGKVIATCALGAAFDAVGMLHSPALPETVFEEIKIKSRCPVAGCTFSDPIPLDSIIVHLNDSCAHRWSRENIADWVETVEKEHELLEYKEEEAEEAKEVKEDLVAV